tara:strand:+ start:3041 stop:3322 length:282 start_codon:yes stop_codon:yes gene_type:complete
MSKEEWKIIKVVRDWFKPNNPNIPRHKEIWLAYNEFEFDYEEILNAEGYDPKDINSLTFSDIIEYMKTWINDYNKILKNYKNGTNFKNRPLLQ